MALADASCESSDLQGFHHFDLTDNIGVVKKARPVNSFMLWRAYYAPMFNGVEQKERSGKLTTLWSNEINQAKWAILAAAYSQIRDCVGKDKAIVGTFLDLMVPKMGIIERESYLQQMGWRVQISNDHFAMARTHVPELQSFSCDIRNTAMTSNDVIEFCRKADYFDPDIDGRHIAKSANGLMAVSSSSVPKIIRQRGAGNMARNNGVRKSSRRPIRSTRRSMTPNIAGLGRIHNIEGMLGDIATRDLVVEPTTLIPFSVQNITSAMPARYDRSYEGIFEKTEDELKIEDVLGEDFWRVGELSDDNQFVDFLSGTVPDYSLPLFPSKLYPGHGQTLLTFNLDNTSAYGLTGFAAMY